MQFSRDGWYQLMQIRGAWFLWEQKYGFDSEGEELNFGWM